MEGQQIQNLVEDFVLHEEKFLGQYVKEITDFHALAESFTDDMTQNRIFITGFPFDEGTYRNGGRIGAENAPKSFRALLQVEKLYIDQELDNNLQIYDLGNIQKVKLPDEDDEEQDHIRARELTLEEAHFYQRQKVGQIIDVNLHFKNKAIVFAIGGSNDQSYCNVLSLFDCYPEQKLGIINIDSQFGVSQLKGKNAHSGSPFRLMLENPIFSKNSSKLIEFGTKGSNCCLEDYEYLKSKGAQVYWLEKDIRRYKIQNSLDYKQDDALENNLEQNKLITQAGQLFAKVLQKLEEEVDIIFLSLDLEAVNAKYCPGVSTPSVIGGLSDQEVLEIMQVTAESKKLVMIDLSEYNPAVESKRTGRFVVNIFYHFAKHFSKNRLI